MHYFNRSGRKLTGYIDITPNNVLQHVSGLDGMAEDKVLQIIGTPVRNPIVCRDSAPRHERLIAPQYLVYPVQWQDVNREYLTEEPCLIDFGESFETMQPPQDLGTPGPYRSPELILDRAAGINSDLWALGCTLFEIRTGRKLFGAFDDDDDSYLDAMVQVLGPLPEPWWSTTWTQRSRLYKDEPDAKGLAVSAVETEEVHIPGVIRVIHPSVAEGAQSLRDMLAPGLWYPSSHGRNGDRHRPIAPEEIEVFADLLGRLLEYVPAERITAKDLLEHEWFRL